MILPEEVVDKERGWGTRRFFYDMTGQGFKREREAGIVLHQVIQQGAIEGQVCRRCREFVGEDLDRQRR